MNAIASSPSFKSLSMQQIGKMAPAIFADSASEKMSENYGFVRTADVIKEMMNEGWFPTTVHQASGRTEDRQRSNRHFVRFRHADNKPIYDDSYLEIVLMNSHNGAAAYQLHAGVFRLVCSNGMVVCDSMFEARKYRHNKESLDDIIEGTYEVIKEAPLITDSVRSLAGKKLNKSQRIEFGRRALQVLPESASKIEPEEIIVPRREEDAGNDLWRLFNVAQENIIRGGLQGVTADGRKVTRRGIGNPRQNVALNKALWQTADDYYQELVA